MLLKHLFEQHPLPTETLQAEREGRVVSKGRWPQRKKVTTKGDFYDLMTLQIGPGLGGSIVTDGGMVASQLMDRGYPSQRMVILADDTDGSIATLRQRLPGTRIYSWRNSADGTGFVDFLSPPVASVMLSGSFFREVESGLALDEFVLKVASILEPGGTITLMHHNPFVVPRSLEGASFLEAFEWSELRSHQGRQVQVPLMTYVMTVHPTKVASPIGKPLNFQEHSDKAGRIREKAPAGKKNRATVPRYTVPDGLPLEPPALWVGRAGRPPHGGDAPLISFLRDNYGLYFEAHRHQLRDYFYNKNRGLYNAIQNYERRNSLPADLAMTTRPERVAERFQNAAENGLESLGREDRRSVTMKLLRHRSPQ